ncbi:hypothetical protein OG828_46275 [Streptomyces sp. NBC_00457]|uniref:hypothetical protein n=1 Tax=unclassified Streptomyces TaxID=2593676 RepID=UPI002E1F3DCC|nr:MULTISPECIES: hypothetical protein [unclassified Streptomyces]
MTAPAEPGTAMPLARGCLQRDAAYLDALGVPVTARSMADRDHFDLPLNLADPATPFGRVSQVHLGLQESPENRKGDFTR